MADKRSDRFLKAVAPVVLGASLVPGAAGLAQPTAPVSPVVVPGRTTPVQVSPTVPEKLRLMRQAQINNAARAIKGIHQGADGYSDFFVDDGRNPWHEAFSDVISGGSLRPVDRAISSKYLQRSAGSRAAFLKSTGGKAADGYSDFFVDDGCNPWHEAFSDTISGRDLRADSKARMQAIRKLSVISAYERIR